ncbi:M23 family metallopeptidase [Siminovitchia sediminis]|uniref:M23 family metallopeptidase n=1 Tax=Siminovitchia sediminis TaxID=1274353 RepID=A0ABW4KNJ9_9BACI
MFSGYRVTSPYGWRIDPITGGRKFHGGIDLVKAHQAPIYSFTEGSVLFAGRGKSGTGLGGYGNVVVIQDQKGSAHLYAHLEKAAVQKGRRIKKGTIIGFQGATGRVTGSHLHYEIRKTASPQYGWTTNPEQSTYNPEKYLSSNGKSENTKSTYNVHASVRGYLTANDASRQMNPKGRVQPGGYFVYLTSQGMINVTTKEGIPGSWINPAENRNTVKMNQTLILPSSSSSWRVYPIGLMPVKGNESGYLNPKKFGGLAYEIIGSPQKDVYTIQTADFGLVNIYAAPHTGAKIRGK